MSNYIQTTIFTPKDSLPSTDPNKTIFGAAYDVEFGNIATAIASKADTNSNPANFLSVVIAGAAGNVSLNVTGVANQFAGVFTASATSGQSKGLQVNAGTTSADFCFAFNNQANTQGYLVGQGDGEIYMFNPTAIIGAPANMFQVGYLDAPLNGALLNYTMVASDRGKQLQHLSGAAHTWTIPPNAGGGNVPFPVGTVIQLSVVQGASTISLTTTDTLRWLPSNVTTVPRTLTGPALATIVKTQATEWTLTGSGIS